MATVEGDGAARFSGLAGMYASSVDAALFARQEVSMLDLRREAELETLGGTLSEAQTAWDGLRDVVHGNIDAARLDRSRLKLAGSVHIAVPMPGAHADTTGTLIPMDVSVTMRPSPARGFAPQQERAARWAVIRRTRAQTALASAILDNLGQVDVVVRAPLRSRNVDLEDPFYRRLAFKSPQAPVELADSWHFGERYDYQRNGNLDDSLIQADKMRWTEKTVRDTDMMAETAGWLATVSWHRPR